MKPSDFVICLLDASGGTIQGRTLLQKRAFFVSVLTENEKELGFGAHYYGPYSPIVDAALAQLKSLGFVDEVPIGFGVASAEGFEIKRYDYRLTEDGRKIAEVIRKREPQEYKAIADSVNRLHGAGDPNYVELSFAAKAFFVLEAKSKPMNRREIIREAGSFDWKIPNHSLERAISFLEKIGLAKST